MINEQIERLKKHVAAAQKQSHKFKLKWKSETGGLKGALDAVRHERDLLRTSLLAMVETFENEFRDLYGYQELFDEADEALEVSRSRSKPQT